MPDLTIFAVGLFTTVLLAAGLAYTVWEFHGPGKRREQEERRVRATGAGIEPGERAA